MKRIAVLVVLALASPASAQVVFPPDAEFTPLRCGDRPMADPRADVASALGERDIVGAFGAPAGLRASDADFLYVRIRLDADPAPGGALAPFSWGMAIDLDGDVQTYELLLLVDNVAPGAPTVGIYENRTVTTPNDPAEPADLPPIATYPFAMAAQTSLAGSTFGDDDDFFLDFAVPWADLVPLGLDHDTPVFVWLASSDAGDALTGDFACRDGEAGGLDGFATDQTIADPAIDSDGDGFTDAEEVAAGSDPNDPNSIPVNRLEGGGGCNTGGGGAGLAVALALVAVRRKRGARRSG